MGYNSVTIRDAVGDINDGYFLPAIQRELVWDRKQIIRLYDSLLRNYPIGSFLFWNVEEEEKHKYVIYKFIQHYITDDRYIETTSRKHNDTTPANDVSDIILILDGQQRLSSLYLGLNGSFTDKEKWKRYENPDAWKRKYLYLNILSDPNKTTEKDGYRLTYDFQFKPEQSADSSEKGWFREKTDKFWFKVGRILDIENDRELDRKIDELISEYPENLSEDQKYFVRHNIEQLYRAIHREDIINYYKVDTQNLDEVLDIFIRTNDGGTELSKSDLLLSLAVGNWEERNAREEITNFVETLNKKVGDINNFSKDFVLKSCLVLSDLSVRYRVGNFTKPHLQQIEGDWKEIREATKKAVRLINRFGVNGNNLTSRNAVIPISYFFMKNPNRNLDSDSNKDVYTRSKIQKWFLSALLNGTFSGQSDNVLREIRNVIQGNENGDFPLEEINKKISSLKKLVGFNDEVIDNILKYEYGDKRTFLALSLIYPPKNWGEISYDQDHIFPQEKFDEKKLREKGFEEDKIDKYMEKKDKLVNLQLLTEGENKSKQEKDFDKWIKTRGESFYNNHLIPKKDNLHNFENFLKFTERREEKIKNHFEEIFS